MLGTQAPSLNKQSKQELVLNQKFQINRSKSSTITQSQLVNKPATRKNFTAHYLNKNRKAQSDFIANTSSIHKFYDFYRLKPQEVFLMPKVYQLNFDENFVNEKELINRTDGVNSRRGT